MGTLEKLDFLKNCDICDNINICVMIDDGEGNTVLICENCLKESLELL